MNPETYSPDTRDMREKEDITEDDIVDFEENCAACGVHERLEDSRYCEGCHDALVQDRHSQTDTTRNQDT